MKDVTKIDMNKGLKRYEVGSELTQFVGQFQLTHLINYRSGSYED